MRIEQFEAAIKEKKNEMIKLGMTKGLQNEDTIYCSQELDKLLNDYNRLLSDNEHSKPINHYDDYFSILTKTYKEFYGFLSDCNSEYTSTYVREIEKYSFVAFIAEYFKEGLVF